MSELLQEQGKWSSPGGGAKRFKSVEGRFEMTWYGAKQQSLTFSGEDGQVMKGKLIASIDRELSKKTKSQKDILCVELNKNSEGEASITHINEGDGFGSMSSVVNALKAKMNRFEQHFENFQSETNRNIDVLFHKSETNSNEQKKEEIDRLREENRQIKLDNAELIQRRNNHAHNIADLNNKVKALEEEKASLLIVIQLLQPNCNDSKVDESNKRDTWSRSSRIRTNNFRRNTPILSNKDTANFNQYTVLPVHETSEDDDEVIEIDNGAESSKEKSTTSPNGDPPKQKHFNISSKANVQTQNDQSRRRPRDEQSPKHKSQDQQDGPNDVVAIVGDSMLKFLDARKLRHSTNIKVAVKTFPGARTEDMMHYVKPTLNKQPSKLIIHVGTNDLSSKSPKEIVTSIAALGDGIKTEDPKIDLTFSEIVLRNGEKAFVDKVNLVNERLDKLCMQRNWGLINHKNIKNIHLNGQDCT
jgi:hypothetical protein